MSSFPVFDRPSNSHKGTFGKIGILAGSRSMPGAAALTASACLRAGAGTATVLCPQSAASVISSVNPCVMTVGLPEDSAGQLHLSAKKEILKQISTFDVVAIGPGWGQSAALQSILKSVLASFGGPIIVDADGLNCLSRLIQTNQVLPRPSENFFLDSDPESEAPTQFPSLAGQLHRPTPIHFPSGRVFLTPHPGEFSRLLHSWQNSSESQEILPTNSLDEPSERETMEEMAMAFSVHFGCYLLLKGPGTYLVGPENHDNSQELDQNEPSGDFGDCGKVFFAHNNTGNAGMATAGSGDVLTGILAAFLGSMPSCGETLSAACHVHGLAGDLAAKKLGQVSLNATDLIDFLPMAIEYLRQNKNQE